MHSVLYVHIHNNSSRRYDCWLRKIIFQLSLRSTTLLMTTPPPQNAHDSSFSYLHCNGEVLRSWPLFWVTFWPHRLVDEDHFRRWPFERLTNRFYAITMIHGKSVFLRETDPVLWLHNLSNMSTQQQFNFALLYVKLKNGPQPEKNAREIIFISCLLKLGNM